MASTIPRASGNPFSWVIQIPCNCRQACTRRASQTANAQRQQRFRDRRKAEQDAKEGQQRKDILRRYRELLDRLGVEATRTRLRKEFHLSDRHLDALLNPTPQRGKRMPRPELPRRA